MQAARANIGHLLASVSPRIEKAAYLMNPSLIAPTLQGLMRRKRPIKSGECGYYVYMDRMLTNDSYPLGEALIMYNP